MAAKPPAIVTTCDDPKWTPDPDGPPGMRSRGECRKTAEAIYCSQPQNLNDPWCREQRERRMRDRQILVIGALVVLAVVWLSD